ncbi:MAG TPA: hypothetical protein VN181_15975 [Thermoanaerobaculia bacterium]|nr:hypothetical protein [Thermoanaerobaculia bacterium]
MPADIRDLWQTQPTEAFRLSSEAFRKQTARRNFDALLAAVFLICGFIGFMTLFDNLLLRAGSILTIAIFVSWAHGARASERAERDAERHAAEMGNVGSLEFHRGQLLRQRALSGGRFWLRWLLMLPGPILFFIGFAQARPDVAPMIGFELLTYLIIMFAMIPLRRRHIRHDERRLEELDRLQKESA